MSNNDDKPEPSSGHERVLIDDAWREFQGIRPAGGDGDDSSAVTLPRDGKPPPAFHVTHER